MEQAHDTDVMWQAFHIHIQTSQSTIAPQYADSKVEDVS
jgi:hypothetical protein